jgi:hypothetical protein
MHSAELFSSDNIQLDGGWKKTKTIQSGISLKEHLSIVTIFDLPQVSPDSLFKFRNVSCLADAQLL